MCGWWYFKHSIEQCFSLQYAYKSWSNFAYVMLTFTIVYYFLIAGLSIIPNYVDVSKSLHSCWQYNSTQNDGHRWGGKSEERLVYIEARSLLANRFTYLANGLITFFICVYNNTSMTTGEFQIFATQPLRVWILRILGYLLMTAFTFGVGSWFAISQIDVMKNDNNFFQPIEKYAYSGSLILYFTTCAYMLYWSVIGSVAGYKHYFRSAEYELLVNQSTGTGTENNTQSV